jgi:hypothetical protein
VTFWLVIQDLAQLRSTYPESWQTFLANVDVVQAFGTNDWDTAQYLSKMTGEGHGGGRVGQPVLRREPRPPPTAPARGSEYAL